jgi:hypothetical protein
MEDVDDLREYSDASTIEIQAAALAEKSRALWVDLQTWHQFRYVVDPAPRYWFESSLLRPEATGSQVDKSEFHFVQYICFSNLETAHSELLYWTGLLLLYSMHYITCCRIRSILGHALYSLTGGDDMFSYPENSKLCSAAHSCAISIAQSLEYFVKPEKGGLGIGMLGFPITVAMGYLRYSNAPESAWFDIVLRYIRQEYAVPLDGLLESMFKGELSKHVRL